MMKNKLFLSILFLMFANIAFSQTESNTPTQLNISTGVGIFDTDGMLKGTVLLSELGYLLKNGYTMTLQGYMAETLNNKRSIDNYNFEFLETYKVASLLFGYKLYSQLKKHALTPMLGPFISLERIVTPDYDLQNFQIKEARFIDIGFAISVRYEYNLSHNSSIGLLFGTNIGYQYGYLYSYAVPVLSIRY